MKESDFAHFLEDETKLKISFEIKQTRLTKQQFTVYTDTQFKIDFETTKQT